MLVCAGFLFFIFVFGMFYVFFRVWEMAFNIFELLVVFVLFLFLPNDIIVEVEERENNMDTNIILIMMIVLKEEQEQNKDLYST